MHTINPIVNKPLKNYIHAYVRDKKRRKVGVVVGTVVADRISFGWSLANTKSGDSFDLKTGIEIAMTRAKINGNLGYTAEKVPHSVVSRLAIIADDSAEYYASHSREAIEIRS